MIKSLRKKFIIFTSIILFVVCQAIAGFIVVFNYVNLIGRIDSSARMIDDKNKPIEEGFHGERNMRFFIIEIVDEAPILNTDKSKDDSINLDNYLSYYEGISGNKGFVNYYRYNQIGDENGNIHYVFINSYIELNSFFNTSLITELVMLLAFVVIFLLIFIFSNKIFKPTIKAYQKQTEFITNASHELKTPLTIISANNELIKYSFNDNEYSSVIENQVTKLNKLINQMIQQARLDEENKLELKEFDLSEVSLDNIQTYERLIKKANLNINYNISNNIMYIGNEALYRQLLSIILDNALKYCDELGTININIEKKKKIIISIANSYKNIDSINIDNIFERFYRADLARSNTNSYGLGLSIASKIVLKHKGEIKAIKHDKEIEFLIKL